MTPPQRTFESGTPNGWSFTRTGLCARWEVLHPTTPQPPLTAISADPLRFTIFQLRQHAQGLDRRCPIRSFPLREEMNLAGGRQLRPPRSAISRMAGSLTKIRR